MATGAPDRGGGRRDGFGAGRYGRTGGRSHVWQPVGHRGPGGGCGGGEADTRGGKSGGWEGAAHGGRGRGRGIGNAGDDSSSNCDRAADNGGEEVEPTAEKSSWEHREEMNPERKHDTQQQDPMPPRQPADQAEVTNKQSLNSSNGCKLCGLKNHTSENCNRRMHCEMCGLNSHRSFECKREPLWNCAPELCAAQVTNQSFFYIEENIDSRASKEKASTAIISVVSGSATAKQIENEFRNLISNDIWVWKAKQISEKKFSMRFPNAKMVQDWGHFRPLGMRTIEAQIVIDPWSPIGAKGELQHAWFKVSGIPSDQRSLRTIAKVGGLVGKTLEIDEKTRYRNDYVRMRIACRDVTQVPAVAESSLGLFIYDFFFEREMIAPAQQPVLSAGVSNMEKCETWRLRGNEAYTEGRLTEAEECYTHGIDSLSPNEASSKALPLMLCYSNRAATRMSLGKMREALSDCRKATDIDSSFLKAQVRAAKCLLALGDVAEAQKAFDMCLKSNNLSSLDHKIVEDASAGLWKAQKISISIRQSKEYLIKKAFDKILDALEMISDALSISIYSDNLMAMKAEALLLLQRYEEVIQFCEETLCVAERNSVCLCVDEHSESNELDNTCSVKLWRHHLIAKSYFCLGKLEKAHQVVKKYEQMEVMECRCGKQSLESISSFSMAISELLRLKAAGNEAFQSGKYLEAVEHYTTALLSNSQSVRFSAICFCNRAAAYQAMGQILDAIADCSLAIALDADYAKAFSRRSSLYELISDYSQAANDLRRLIALLEKQLQENMSMPLEKTEIIRSNLNQANLRLSSLERNARKGASSNMYLILGIEPSSSAVDTKKAYHKAALRHHPDKAGKFLIRSENISDVKWREIRNEIRRDADYLFKIIGQAYATLSDPTMKGE